MIRTDAEYRWALGKREADAHYIEELRIRLRELDLSPDEVHRALQPTLSFTAGLDEEIQVYEQMCRGDLGQIQSLRQIGHWLIGARIARGLSQQELAEQLGTTAKKVARDERNEYYGITLSRAQRILDLLGIRFRADITGPVLAAHNLDTNDD